MQKTEKEHEKQSSILKQRCGMIHRIIGITKEPTVLQRPSHVQKLSAYKEQIQFLRISPG